MNTSADVPDPVELATRYLRAIEERAPVETLAAFFHEAAVFEELPNRLVPSGAVSDRAAIVAAAERGRRVLDREQYQIRSAIAQGDRVALEVDWCGTLAVPYGALPVGYQLRARLGMFLELRDGRILCQRNYDCYEPW